MSNIQAHTGNTFREDDLRVASRLQLQPGDRLEIASGSYDVQAALGEGGFGTVHRIIDKQGQAYAFKSLKLWEIMPQEQGEIADRFIREYKAGKIDSPYIVGSIHYGKVLGNPYIIMEYCPGGNLLDRIKDFQNPQAYRSVAIQVLRGLEALHDAGVIHRDIKPENILFDQQGSARLTDFGISGHVNKRATQPNWRGHVRQMWGTVVYMAPEQQDYRKAFKSMGPQTDMFAFGVMSYQVLSGGAFPFGSFEDYLKDPRAYNLRMKQGQWRPLEAYQATMEKEWLSWIGQCLEPALEKRIKSPSLLLAKMGLGNHPAPADPHNRPTPELPSAGYWQLKVLNGDGSGDTYHLNILANAKGKSLLSMGWLDEDDPHINDIGILDRHSNYISTFHATLEYDGHFWYLRDGQWCDKYGEGKMAWHPSTNGSRVNFYPINSQTGCRLHPEDILVIGDTTLKVKFDANPDS